MKVDARQLRYFSEVFERGNLRYAAEALNVSQSAISVQIANLEQELGVKLFVRGRKGMSATVAGERLHTHARTILHQIELAKADVSAEDGEPAGPVAIALPFTVMRMIGLIFIQTVRLRMPKVRLSIQEALSADCHRMLLQGEVDLALAYNPPAAPGTTQKALVDESICCVGRPDLLQAFEGDKIAFAQARKLPQIILRQGTASWSITRQGSILRQLHEAAVLELNSVAGMREALLTGLGVSACPLVTVGDLVATGQLRALEFVKPKVERTLHLLASSVRAETSTLSAVATLLVEEIDAQVRSGTWRGRRL